MFKAISTFFSTITEAMTGLNIIARTGTKYALQFEADAQTQLAKKRAALAQQEELAEAITIEATP